jgi:hypothetical protein
MYQVKWEGYEKRSDMTWEPEENLLYVNSGVSFDTRLLIAFLVQPIGRGNTK